MAYIKVQGGRSSRRIGMRALLPSRFRNGPENLVAEKLPMSRQF